MGDQDYYELIDILDLNLPRIIFQSLDPIASMTLMQWYAFRELVKRIPLKGSGNPNPSRMGYGIEHTMKSYGKSLWNILYRTFS